MFDARVHTPKGLLIRVHAVPHQASLDALWHCRVWHAQHWDTASRKIWHHAKSLCCEAVLCLCKRAVTATVATQLQDKQSEALKCATLGSFVWPAVRLLLLSL